MTKKEKLKVQLAESRARLAHGWTLNSPVMVVVGAVGGMTATMYWKGAHDAAMVMVGQFSREGIIALLCLVVMDV